MDPSQEYVAELNEVESRFKTAAQLMRFLDHVETAESAKLWVQMERPTSRAWFQRLLGAPEREVSPCFSLSKDGAYATLIFHDDAWSEYRALDHEQPVQPEKAVRLRLSMGEPTPAPVDECLLASCAFEAVRHYLKHGSRPEWLNYRYVM